jgi:DNA-binding transcriptional ArsR family regulator
MTITGPKVRDFTGSPGRLPVNVVVDPLFELLLSIFVWISHENPESDAEYTVGAEWFDGVRTAASPELLGLLAHFTAIEELWIGIVGLAYALPEPRSVAALADHLRTTDPVALRLELIVAGCAMCRDDENAAMADQAAAGDAAAIEAIGSMAGCKMTPAVRDLLLMKPAVTAELLASTIEVFDRDVFKGGGSITGILERDANSKRIMATSMEPHQLVEMATNGITFTMRPEVDGIVLIPSIVIRPWVTITESGRQRLFCYPVAEEHLTADPDAPPSWLVGVYRALGDERRLRLLRILSEGPTSLADITARIDLSKSTVHHHLSVLRQAGLVRITLGGDKEYSLRRETVPEIGRLLDGFLAQGALERT